MAFFLVADGPGWQDRSSSSLMIVREEEPVGTHRLNLLGGFDLLSPAGSPISLTARKPMALLAYLALRPGQSHPREKLATLLWEDSPDALARSSLRQALALLRRCLPILTAEGDGVAVPTGTLATDVAEFRAAVADGSPAQLARAAELYRGDLFDGAPSRSPGFEDWLQVERQHLREQVQGVLGRLLDHALESGDAEAGVRHALRLLALDPLREPAHRALMRLYARQGRHAAALKQYQTCRTVLERELGVRPEPETEALLREIRERRRASRADPPDPAAAPLPEAGEAPPRPFPSAPELRVAAILCAALSGSDTDDPEEMHRQTADAVGHVERIARSYGGDLYRHVGNTVIAAFGARRSHGNDPERALRAALDLRAGVDGTAEPPGIGVSCGLVVVDGGPDFVLTGTAMQEGNRLATLAGPGDILVSRGVREALDGFLDLEGGGGPPWRVRGFRTAGTGKAAASRPFVGRRAELHQFNGLLAACRETGSGTVIHIRGEPGIGKTRLVEEFQAMAGAQELRCVTGCVLDFGVGRGQDAIKAVVRALADLPAAGTLGPEHGIHLAPLLDRPLPPDQRSVYDALDHGTRDLGRRAVISALVRAAAGDRPLVLTIEDVHWADAQVQPYVAMLAGLVADCPLILVLTTRVQGDPLDAAWRAAAGGVPIMTIDLGPLRPAEAQALAQTLARAMAADDRTFAESCVTRSGGNPLFLEQLLRSRGTGGSVPDTIHCIVLARTDALPPADRRALQAASVLGQRFDLDALRTLLDDPDYGMAALLDQALVRPAAPDGGNGGGYLFAHALVQEAVHSGLLRSRRCELHRRAAAWYAGRDPALHAEHLAQAEDPGAAAAFLEAARFHAAGFRFERALSLVERGLALDCGRPERFELACLHGEVLDALGSVAPSIRSYGQARDLAETDAERCRAWLGLASGMRVVDDLSGAMDALEHAEAAAMRAGLAAERFRIHHLRGNLCFPRGDLDGCLREHEAALDWARRSNEPDLELHAMSGLGDAYYLRGRMITAHGYFSRCVRRARGRSLPRIEAENLYMDAVTRFFMNDPGAALATARESIDVAVRIGHRRAELLSHIVANEMLGELGDEEAGRPHFARAQALAAQLGAWRFEAENLLGLGRMALHAGRREEGLDLLRQALEIALRTGEGYLGPSILALMALAGEDPDERRRLLDEGAAMLARGSVSHNHLYFHREAIETALDMGDWDAAERYADGLEDYASPEPLPWSSLFTTRGRLLARFGRGERGCDLRQDLARVLKTCRAAALDRHTPRIERALGEF
ncbi:BTAD domain-containing putative transcriptional regulator [Skermanella rosea]|uniref:BTAD domain-containing putative transcriptional regulator n=1 Tax=Skermanella rosea TaxID=1817965 RepID=UPI00193433B1|nr:BTAD domain-containing putative transcriptional regulator [Skermanella rosea]